MNLRNNSSRDLFLIAVTAAVLSYFATDQLIMMAVQSASSSSATPREISATLNRNAAAEEQMKKTDNRSSLDAMGTSSSSSSPTARRPPSLHVALAILTHEGHHTTRLAQQFLTWLKHYYPPHHGNDGDVGTVSDVVVPPPPPVIIATNVRPSADLLRQWEDGNNDDVGNPTATSVSAPSSRSRRRRRISPFVAPQFTGKVTLGRKAMATWMRFCTMRIDAPYYAMLDDDTFLVMRNLEEYLASLTVDGDTMKAQNNKRLLNPYMDDLFTGYLLNHGRNHLIGGGGGIVLSNRSLRRLCTAALLSPTSSPCAVEGTRTLAGDVATAACMKSVGVKPSHAPGFFPFPLNELIKPKPNWCTITWWFPKHIPCPPGPKAVSFHYVPSHLWEQLYFWSHLFRGRGL